ncbi:MAG: putative bifunctional diguanylate cyclase/phosphodiesterase [Pyrinomonadaceae bacterium]|jgi:diguanylate cyclase (GGDEF)-like protein
MNKRVTITSLYILFLMPVGAIALACASFLLHYGQKTVAAITFVVSVICFVLIIVRHIRFVRWMRREAATAETAERFRAEQAEVHVAELQHYIDELEKSAHALRESRERFRHAAYHDALTGLGNRNKLLESAAECLRNTAENAQFAVIILDLNRFKTVNDSLGHFIGDRLLIMVGERLVNSIKDLGVVSRLGGDDFAVLLPFIKSEREAERYAETIISALSDSFDIDGRSIFTKASAGIAISGKRYNSPEEILRDADIALYHAKETGRDIVVFDTIMHERAVKLLEIETDLRFAFERNEFVLYYQPIIDLDAMELAGFEALVRWNHPCRGLVTPQEFISVAEASGLIQPITIKLLRSACEQLAAWNRQFENRRLFVSVNLSAGHLSRSGIVDALRSILYETETIPDRLKLEITESAVMEDADRAITILRKIKDLGVGLSIDDFGTGYSSLSYLQRLPVDTLKIDRSFVSSMQNGADNGEIVRTVIAMAKALKLDVVAEGVETVHHLHQLRILGCEYGQGYLFSRPVTADEAQEIITNSTRWHSILPETELGILSRNLEYTQLRIN